MRANPTSFAVATCVFGSVARGDNDFVSDKDILIVSADSDRRVAEGIIWKERGWSVASYTPGRLITMSRAGSLFLQHLKAEGLVIKDTDGFLRDILSAYHPRADYSHDVAECLLALRLLEQCQPTASMSYWAADVLFVIFRNAAILQLANDRLYKFSFAEIAKAFYDRSLIDSDDLQALSSLRKAKAAYRNHHAHNNGVWHTVDAVLRIIEKLFSVSIGREFQTHSSALELRDPYFSLRGIEKLLLESGIADGTSSAPTAIRHAWKLIVDPRIYSWEIRTRHHMVLESVRQILNDQSHSVRAPSPARVERNEARLNSFKLPRGI